LQNFQQEILLDQLAQKKLRLQLAKEEKEREERQKLIQAAEDRDTKSLQQVLPGLQEKTKVAESFVTRALDSHKMITDADDNDNFEELFPVVERTENMARMAGNVLREATRLLEHARGGADRFESEAIKERAIRELSSLLERIKASEEKLEPMMAVRETFQKRVSMRRNLQEFRMKIFQLETETVNIEQAAMMLMNAAGPNKMFQLQKIQQVGGNAQFQVNTMCQAIEKMKTEDSPEELVKLDERAQKVRQRLLEIAKEMNPGAKKEDPQEVTPKSTGPNHVAPKAVAPKTVAPPKAAASSLAMTSSPGESFQKAKPSAPTPAPKLATVAVAPPKAAVNAEGPPAAFLGKVAAMPPGKVMPRAVLPPQAKAAPQQSQSAQELMEQMHEKLQQQEAEKEPVALAERLQRMQQGFGPQAAQQGETSEKEQPAEVPLSAQAKAGEAKQPAGSDEMQMRMMFEQQQRLMMEQAMQMQQQQLLQQMTMQSPGVPKATSPAA